MESQTSVLITSAFLAAIAGSVHTLTWSHPNSRMKLAGGWHEFGDATVRSNCKIFAAHIQDRVILEKPSPTKANFLPSQVPSFSRTVRRSARIWQGCSSSVKALIVGTFENRAKSTTSCWAKVRMITPCTIRPSTLAVSLMGSPLPNCISFPERNIGNPPSSRTPTSNETRVLVEDFVKIMAHVCPAKGWEICAPRSDFSRTASSTRAEISGALSCSMESKCFICLGSLSGLIVREDALDDDEGFVHFLIRYIQGREQPQRVGTGRDQEQSLPYQSLHHV